MNGYASGSRLPEKIRYITDDGITKVPAYNGKSARFSVNQRNIFPLISGLCPLNIQTITCAFPSMYGYKLSVI
jgi:hypothetical protein